MSPPENQDKEAEDQRIKSEIAAQGLQIKNELYEQLGGIYEKSILKYSAKEAVDEAIDTTMLIAESHSDISDLVGFFTHATSSLKTALLASVPARILASILEVISVLLDKDKSKKQKAAKLALIVITSFVVIATVVGFGGLAMAIIFTLLLGAGLANGARKVFLKARDHLKLKAKFKHASNAERALDLEKQIEARSEQGLSSDELQTELDAIEIPADTELEKLTIEKHLLTREKQKLQANLKGMRDKDQREQDKKIEELDAKIKTLDIRIEKNTQFIDGKSKLIKLKENILKKLEQPYDENKVKEFIKNNRASLNLPAELTQRLEKQANSENKSFEQVYWEQYKEKSTEKDNVFSQLMNPLNAAEQNLFDENQLDSDLFIELQTTYDKTYFASKTVGLDKTLSERQTLINKTAETMNQLEKDLKIDLEKISQWKQEKDDTTKQERKKQLEEEIANLEALMDQRKAERYEQLGKLSTQIGTLDSKIETLEQKSDAIKRQVRASRAELVDESVSYGLGVISVGLCVALTTAFFTLAAPVTLGLAIASVVLIGASLIFKGIITGYKKHLQKKEKINSTTNKDRLQQDVQERSDQLFRQGITLSAKSAMQQTGSNPEDALKQRAKIQAKAKAKKVSKPTPGAAQSAGKVTPGSQPTDKDRIGPSPASGEVRADDDAKDRPKSHRNF